VQTQRNELKQALKDERAQITTLKENLATITADRDSFASEMQSITALASERELSLKARSLLGGFYFCFRLRLLSQFCLVGRSKDQYGG
jgi:hypothetical protein